MSRETTDRECPRCGLDGVVSRREAERVYSSGSEVIDAFRRDMSVTHVCSKCGAFKQEDDPHA